MQEAPLPYNEEARLQELHQYEVLDTAAEDDIDDLTLLAAHLCDTPIALVSLVDSNRQWFKSKVGVSATETSRAIAFCAHSILQTDVFVVPDALDDERFADNPLVTGEPGIRFYAGAPLMTPDGYPLGTLCVIDRAARQFDPDQKDILRALARQVVRRLEQRRQLNALKRATIERTQVVEALRQSEERLRLVIQGANDGIWDWNMHTRQNITSAHWKEMLGYGEGELPDTDAFFFDALHPDDRPTVQERLRQHLEERRPYAIEIRMRHKDGRYRWFLTRGEVVRTAQGMPVRMVGSLTDITARKEAETALKETEERWQYAFEGCGDGVWDWNAQTNKVFFSTRWKTMLGFEPHEIGDTLSEWDSRVHPDDKAAVYQSIQKHFEGETDLYITEHRILCKDGSYKWILDRGKVVSRDAQGKPLRVVGTHIDLTERKRAEERLRQSEAFISSVLNHLPSVVFVKEARDLRYVRFNRACEELLGISEQEILGKNNYDLFPAEAAGEFTAKDREVLASGRLIDISEERIETPHGIRYLHTRKIPIFDADGEPQYLVGISEDITERKQMVEALRTSHAELEQRVAERTVDLAASNHALRVEIDERRRTEAALREVNQMFQAVIDTSPLAVVGLDRSGTHVTLWNASAERIFGWSAGEILGRPLPYIPAGEEEHAQAVWAQTVRDGVLHGAEVRRLRKDGTVVEVALWGVALQEVQGAQTGTFCFVADITERKQLEAMRQAHAVIDSVMQERDAIMLNLHDGLLQSLYALRLGLEHSRRLLAAQPGKAQESLDMQVEDLGLMIAEVRRFMVGQDPVWAQAETLRDGLETLIDTYRGATAVDWQLELPERDEVVADLSQPEIRHLLYIVREAISNVVRHASATRCRIALVLGGNRVQVAIEDDGRGFNPAASRRQGLGMGNMEARARQIGAAIDLSSAPGTGTRIVINTIRRATHVSI